MAELKRRDLSGIYIFDTFPGEQKRQPTCIEDCQPERPHHEHLQGWRHRHAGRPLQTPQDRLAEVPQ